MDDRIVASVMVGYDGHRGWINYLAVAPEQQRSGIGQALMAEAEQIIKKLRDADAMLAADKSVGEVLQALEISEATLSRWRSQYDGMKSEEAKRLKALEEENNRLKKIVPVWRE